MSRNRRFLLVLDINGLLLDTYFQGETPRLDRPHDAKVNRFYVYKRAFCDEFIEFCLQNFFVGVWSSARAHNVESLVDYMFKEARESLAFVWHQQHCTDTGFRHPENKYKPVFLKQLSRLWEKFEPDLPWARGEYGPANTLLIDDSPYKAIDNPRHTAIFPKTYKATDPEDNYLALALRPYLEGLLQARDVRQYVAQNPIGEPHVNPTDPQWSQILKSGEFKNIVEEELVPAHLMGIGGPIRSKSIISGNQWPRPGSMLPINGGLVPPHILESPTWNAADGDQRWRPSTPPHQNLDYDGGRYDQQRLRHDLERDTGPSWPSRHVPGGSSQDLARQHAMLSVGRPNDYVEIPRVADWPPNGSYNRLEKRGPLRDYENRGPEWPAAEEADFSQADPWSFHRGVGRDQEGSYLDGNRKRRLDWSREPKVVTVNDNGLIQARDQSRERVYDDSYPFQRRASPRHDVSGRPIDYGEISRGEDRTSNDFRGYKRFDKRNNFVNRALGWSEEPEDITEGDELTDFRRGGARAPDGSYQGDGNRKRRLDWIRDPRGMSMDKIGVMQARDIIREREFENGYGYQRRGAPRHDQFIGKPREFRRSDDWHWSEELEDFRQGAPWDFREQEGGYHSERKRRRRPDWTRDTTGMSIDEIGVTPRQGLSRDREFRDPFGFARGASPRHDPRKEASQFRDKPKEGGMILHRYADEEHPRKRHLSEDRERRFHKHNEGSFSQHRDRRKNGRKD